MPRLEGVAIPMSHNVGQNAGCDASQNVSDNGADSMRAVRCLYPAGGMARAEYERLKSLPALRIFDERICEFLHALSQGIMNDVEARGYADMLTFGFFIRRGSVEGLKRGYEEHNAIGRGLSLHIAPSNVAINFAYSLAVGLLAGNACVVRVSSKPFRQTQILCRLLEGLRSKYEVARYILIVQYPHNMEITRFLSRGADVRLIWGGDSTIEALRQAPLPPRGVELCFASRYSVCALDSKALLRLGQGELEALAKGFYNDTYLYDQNACSSPRLVYWLGREEVSEARERFWRCVWLEARERYALEPIAAVDKLIAECSVALNIEGARVENAGVSGRQGDKRQGDKRLEDKGLGNRGDNLVSRIFIPSLEVGLERYACACGSFIESSGECIDELLRVASKQYQTLAYFGLDPQMILERVKSLGIAGIDRIVPLGRTSDFALKWDGYDMIRMMSRVIDVR